VLAGYKWTSSLYIAILRAERCFPPHPPIFFDDTIKAWVVTRPPECEAILSSLHVVVPRYHEIYEEMAARNPDFAFPNLVFAFKYIPMSLNADEHRVARRRIAEFIAARKSAISALVLEMVDRRVDPFAQRRERQEIEVMAEHDALTGSMGESLHQLFRQNPGVPLTKIDFPTVPNETGVAFAERIVEQPFDFDGTSFRLGDRIRIMLQSFAYSSDAATRTRMFGAGLHTCLGRQLSLELWSALARRLSQIRARVDIIDYRSVDDDYVSTCPSRLLIALRP
jgi:cytochrome P450